VTLRVSAEEALLIAAAGRRCVPAGAAAGARIDWQRLVDGAQWHRMLPLLWEHLRSERADIAVPSEVAAVLQEATRLTAARNVRLEHERDRILAVLAQEGIPAILLKGAALVAAVYPHVALRPMGDLDLLVPEASVRRAHDAVAKTLGYTVVGARLTRDDDARLAKRQHHFPLLSPDRTVELELHHRILDDRPDYDVAGIWQRAVTVDARQPYLLQVPEDLMLHVASHFTFDRIHRGEGSLGQLADMVRIHERWTLDWEAVADSARRSHVGDRLFLALNSAAQLFGDVAPPAVTQSLAPQSYTPALGMRFVRQRVLRARPALPLEQLSEGPVRLTGRLEALERYVDPDEDVVPSLTRLRARRWRALAMRLVRETPKPQELVDDIRLSRWMLSLRR
jgi:hypothetical protein